MFRLVPQLVALLLSVVPWAALASPRPTARPDAALSSPHQPAPSLEQAVPGGAPLPAGGAAIAARPAPTLRAALVTAGPRVALEAHLERRAAHLRFARLQLDGP